MIVFLQNNAVKVLGGVGTFFKKVLTKITVS